LMDSNNWQIGKKKSLFAKSDAAAGII
jgi:hypothetical protein